MSPNADVAGVLRLLDELAPPELAEGWDHVGLQVGRPDQEVARVRVALEVTPALLTQLAGERGTLVVTHHPLLFRPLEGVRTDGAVGRALAVLLSGGHALVACHTNWDKAPGGNDDVLAALVGMADAAPIRPEERALYRLSVLVPEEHLDAVREAMAAAGAGESERYRRASFSVEGESTFEAKEGARPAYGEVGEFRLRAERRLEMVVEGPRLAAVERALLSAHPYEEPAYGVDRLVRGRALGGLGRIGVWPRSGTLGELAAAVRAALGAPALRVVGDPGRRVRRLATVSGAGRSLLADAARLGADAIVTADIGHHDARTAEELGLGVVDAGHRETEEPGVRALTEALARRLEAEGVGLPVAFSPVAPALVIPGQGG